LDDVGEFVEWSSVAGFEDFPVFELGDAVFDSGSEAGDRGVECFLPLFPGGVGCSFDWCECGGGNISGISDPLTGRMVKAGLPAA
jgi:hypothetical protein